MKHVHSKGTMIASTDEYQIGYDADALTKAVEIMADKPRFARAKAHYQKRQDQLDKLTCGLRGKV